MKDAKHFPDWGKMEFHDYPNKQWSETLPDTGDDARDLVSKLLLYQSGDRLSASQVSCQLDADSNFSLTAKGSAAAVLCADER